MSFAVIVADTDSASVRLVSVTALETEEQARAAVASWWTEQPASVQASSKVYVLDLERLTPVLCIPVGEAEPSDVAAYLPDDPTRQTRTAYGEAAQESVAEPEDVVVESPDSDTASAVALEDVVSDAGAYVADDGPPPPPPYEEAPGAEEAMGAFLGEADESEVVLGDTAAEATAADYEGDTAEVADVEIDELTEVADAAEEVESAESPADREEPAEDAGAEDAVPASDPLREIADALGAAEAGDAEIPAEEQTADVDVTPSEVAEALVAEEAVAAAEETFAVEDATAVEEAVEATATDYAVQDVAPEPAPAPESDLPYYGSPGTPVEAPPTEAGADVVELDEAAPPDAVALDATPVVEAPSEAGVYADEAPSESPAESAEAQEPQAAGGGVSWPWELEDDTSSAATTMAQDPASPASGTAAAEVREPQGAIDAQIEPEAPVAATATATDAVESGPATAEPAADEQSAGSYEPGRIDMETYTCDDCVYEGTCPKKGEETPATCGSFQWRAS
jgi:hypothetical protein